VCPVAPDPDEVAIVAWGHDRLDDLTALGTLAFPDEALGAEDLELLCFGDDTERRTVVLGTADGTAAAVVGLDVSASSSAAYLHLLAVHPARRRRGLAGAVVHAAEDWARGLGATAMEVGGAVPFYLFSGVDTRWTDALCLFESLGYGRTAVVLDLVCPTVPSTRRPIPPGVSVHHVETDEHLGELCEFARAEYPHWVEEFRRAGESGTVVLARDGRDGRVLGAAAHSVSRFGVVGPVAVAAGGRRSGVGTALMGAVLGDLSIAGLRNAEIAWTSTVGFYAKACGARVGRASQLHRRNLAAVCEE
jgi:GNAT superfamily N-acetyltransferase